MLVFASEISPFVIFVFLAVAFSALRSSSISYKSGFVVLNSSSFCVPVRLLVSPSNGEDLGE